MSKQSKCNEWIVDIVTNNWAENVNLALKKLNNLMGAGYKAIAQLATQRVEGTNYLVLAKQIICQNLEIKNNILISFYASPKASDISDIEIHSIQQLPHNCTTITVPKNQKIDISHLIFDFAPKDSQTKLNSTISSEQKTDTNEWEFDPNGWELDFFAAKRPKEVDSAIDKLNQENPNNTYKAIAYLGKQDFKDSTKGINYAITAEQAIGGEKNIVLVIFNVKNDIINISHNIKILKYNENTKTYDISFEPTLDIFKDVWKEIKPIFEKTIHLDLNTIQSNQNNEGRNNDNHNDNADWMKKNADTTPVNKAQNSDDQICYSKWMKEISDTTPINHLNIPGTHDTLTGEKEDKQAHSIKAFTIFAIMCGIYFFHALIMIGSVRLVFLHDKYNPGSPANHKKIDIIISIVLGILGALSVVYWSVIASRITLHGIAQKLKLKDQLNIGCRFIDIRIDSNFIGSHGNDVLGLTTTKKLFGEDGVMDDIKKFLKDNPSEFIVMRIQGTEHRDPPECKKITSEIIEKKDKDGNFIYKDLFWKRVDHDDMKEGINYWPLLKDVRGKLIVIDHLGEHPFATYKEEPYYYGINLDDDKYLNGYFYKIQNEYDHPGRDDKWKFIKNFINNTDYKDNNNPYEDPKHPDYKVNPLEITKMKINYVSAEGAPFSWTPGEYADYLNPLVVEDLNKKIKDNKKCITGSLLFDFLDKEIANVVISTNFIKE